MPKTQREQIEKCYFCESKNKPDYKEALILRRYINDRGKIMSAGRTGVCSKHQRGLSASIKRARQMLLLPYTERHAI